jgi:hypothetical protein
VDVRPLEKKKPGDFHQATDDNNDYQRHDDAVKVRIFVAHAIASCCMSWRWMPRSCNLTEYYPSVSIAITPMGAVIVLKPSCVLQCVA